MCNQNGSSPVIYCQSHIFCTVLQGDMGVLGAELDVLTAGVGHCERQAHAFKLLSCSLVVPDVHQAGNEVLVNLERAKQINEIARHLQHSMLLCLKTKTKE